MSTLEERILCQNVPGRYSEWQGERDDVRHEDDDNDRKNKDNKAHESCESDSDNRMDEMQLHQQMAESGVPDPVRQTMYGQQTGARTGVKGVLKDYKETKKVEKIEKELERQHREYILKQMVHGSTVATSSVSSATQTQKPKETLSEDSEDSDDEFLKNYREQRMNQLKSMAYRPTFGQVKEVDAFEFLEGVDNEDPRTFVVVHLYEPYIKQCSMMNNYLEILAQKYQFVKFLRLLSSAASESYDHIALPTLMIYRNRQQLHTLVRVQDDLGENFTIKDVEWLLESCDVFEPIVDNQNPNTSTNQNSNKITNYSVQYDDLVGDEFEN